jgi:hypothetical protein
MWHDRHLAESTLQALDDGELPPLAALRAMLHLGRCRECRERRAAGRRLHEQARTLLTLAEQPVDTREGWLRLCAVRPQVGSSGRRRFTVAAWALAVVMALSLAAVAHFRSRSGAPEPLARRDICCWDLDGGGPGDDGVMTVSRPGEQLACVVLYDDVDRSRSLTRGDVIRYVSRESACGLPSLALPQAADGRVLARLAAAP